MVVPLSLDPGKNDPNSPLFEGCHSCGTPGAPHPCRECKREQQRAEAQAAHWEAKAREHKRTQAILEAIEEEGALPDHLGEQLPDEVQALLEHRAESAYQSLQEEQA